MSLAIEAPALAMIDGQAINLANQPDLIARIRTRALAGQGFCLFTLNLDHLVKRRSDPAFRQAYARASFVSADGAPVVALARRQGTQLTRTTGADLIEPLCAMAAREGLPLFFFGSSQVLLGAAADELRRRFPGLLIAGCEAPPFGFDPLSPAADAAGDRMAASGAKLCLIALGAPKQELFADRMLARHPGMGCLCIGAALDFIAGGQKRAPILAQSLGLEWVWRLATNPRRLFVRYARCAMLMLDLACVAPERVRLGAPSPSKTGAK